jgi:peptide/nickel transport system substrate-binding protein
MNTNQPIASDRVQNPVRLLSFIFPGGVIAAAALAALVLAPGLSRAATPADTLVMAKNIDDIVTLDPAEVFEDSANEICANVYDRVMTYDIAKPAQLAPGVADSQSFSADGKVLTLKIHKGITFHSGNPLTAEDVAFSIQRVVKLNLNPAFIIAQVGLTKDNVEELVKAVDPETVTVRISGDFAPSFVLNALASGPAAVVDKKLVLEHQKGDDLGHEWLKTNDAGSGPFVMKSWKGNDTVLLDRAENHWRGAPAMLHVVIRHVPEAGTQQVMVEKGDADIARNLTRDQVQALAGNKDVKIETSAKAANILLNMNQADDRLKNPKVRDAIRHLIDYDGMAQSFLKGQQSVHQTWWYTGFFGALDENPYKLDVAKAKQLLAEAGYPNGFELSFDAMNSAPYTDIAQSIQSTMAQAGIKVQIISAEKKQVITKFRARNHQLLMNPWTADYLDPHANADAFTMNTDNNGKLTPILAWRNNWVDPIAQEMTSAAVREKDDGKRSQLYQDLQRRMLNESPFVFMFEATDQIATRSNLSGFVNGPSFDNVFYRLVKKS